MPRTPRLISLGRYQLDMRPYRRMILSWKLRIVG